MASSALVFDGTVLPQIHDYATLFAGVEFERPREGINTIGGFCTLQGQQVFVKFLGKRVALRAALVDSLKPLFGLSSNGCCVARVRMPDGGVSLPWAKREGAQMLRKGLEWVLITRRLPGITVTRHILRACGHDDSKVDLTKKTPIYRLLESLSDKRVIHLLTPVLAFRLIFGVADMGLGNFVYDEAGQQVFSVDEGSAFADTCHPEAGHGGARRSLLLNNLLPKEFGWVACREGLHRTGASAILEHLDVTNVCAQIDARIRTHYLPHDKAFAGLLEDYVRPNLLTLKESLYTLLTYGNGALLLAERSAAAAATATSGSSTPKRDAEAAGDLDVPASKRHGRDTEPTGAALPAVAIAVNE